MAVAKSKQQLDLELSEAEAGVVPEVKPLVLTPINQGKKMFKFLITVTLTSVVVSCQITNLS